MLEHPALVSLVGLALSLGLIRYGARLLADLVAPTKHGALLSRALLAVGGQLERYLLSLPQFADSAWQATEERAAQHVKAIAANTAEDAAERAKEALETISQDKKEHALKILKERAPWAKVEELEQELMAAHRRNAAAGREHKLEGVLKQIERRQNDGSRFVYG